MLLAFERQHLSTAVIAARWASDVRRDTASALGTLVQLPGMPTVRCFARAQPHLGCFAFWDSHGSELGKQEIRKRQWESRIFESRIDVDVTNLGLMFLDLQFIQCAPVRLASCILLRSFNLIRLAKAMAVPVAMRMHGQV